MTDAANAKAAMVASAISQRVFGTGDIEACTLEIPDSINPGDCLHIDTEPSYGRDGEPIHGLLRVWAKYDVAHLTPDTARAVAAALNRWADTGELRQDHSD